MLVIPKWTVFCCQLYGELPIGKLCVPNYLNYQTILPKYLNTRPLIYVKFHKKKAIKNNLFLVQQYFAIVTKNFRTRKNFQPLCSCTCLNAVLSLCIMSTKAVIDTVVELLFKVFGLIMIELVLCVHGYSKVDSCRFIIIYFDVFNLQVKILKLQLPSATCHQ